MKRCVAAGSERWVLKEKGSLEETSEDQSDQKSGNGDQEDLKGRERSLGESSIRLRLLQLAILLNIFLIM